MGKKNSLVMDGDTQGMGESRLQSLKKIKEKQERNYHMLKKKPQSRNKI